MRPVEKAFQRYNKASSVVRKCNTPKMRLKYALNCILLLQYKLEL